MPKIHAISLPLERRDLLGIAADTAAALSRPLDDLPLVTTISDAVELLRRANRGSVLSFRIEDDPSVLVAWHSFGRAAMVHTFRRRRLVQIDVILLADAADDAVAVERARSGLALTGAEVEQITRMARPALVRISRDSDEGIVGLLALVLYAPTLCEVHGLV